MMEIYMMCFLFPALALLLALVAGVAISNIGVSHAQESHVLHNDASPGYAQEWIEGRYERNRNLGLPIL